MRSPESEARTLTINHFAHVFAMLLKYLLRLATAKFATVFTFPQYPALHLASNVTACRHLAAKVFQT